MKAIDNSTFPSELIKTVKECYNLKAKDPTHVKICKKFKNPVVGSFIEALVKWSI
jgi:hypothetical protein